MHLQLGDTETIASRVIMHDVHLCADCMPEQITVAVGGRCLQIKTAAKLQPYLDASALADGAERETALRALVRWCRDLAHGLPVRCVSLTRFVRRRPGFRLRICALAQILSAAWAPRCGPPPDVACVASIRCRGSKPGPECTQFSKSAPKIR